MSSWFPAGYALVCMWMSKEKNPRIPVPPAGGGDPIGGTQPLTRFARLWGAAHRVPGLWGIVPAVLTHGFAWLSTGRGLGQTPGENAAMQVYFNSGDHCGIMSTHSRTLFWSACAALILACLSAGCSSSTSPAPSAAATQTPAAGGNTIAIRNFAFSPSTLTVKAGTTVTWTNDDSPPHQLASDPGHRSSSSPRHSPAGHPLRLPSRRPGPIPTTVRSIPR